MCEIIVEGGIEFFINLNFIFQLMCNLLAVDGVYDPDVVSINAGTVECLICLFYSKLSNLWDSCCKIMHFV